MKHSRFSYTTWWPELALLVACSSSSGDQSGNGSTKASVKGAGTARPSSGAAGSSASSGATANASVGNADGLTVEGPITGGMGKIFTASSADLAGQGYTEKEFFFGGQATAYAVPGGMTMDGKWTLTETTKAPFKSRLLVRRPMDASKFNGTVVVEWLNVSGGLDANPDYSFDIYSQAAKAIRHSDVLEGLQPERLIAYGESQSAMRMVSYVDGVHPLAKVYDGFFILSRGAGGVPFAGGAGGISLGGFGGGGTVFIRDDIDQKVFQFQTETDVTGMLAFLPARQPDSDKLRTWEVAGTSHADQYLVDFNASMISQGAVQCDGANTGPQYRVIRAALHSLHSWMRDGTEPARGEVLQTDSSGKSLRDDHGNALGGVRSPDVDVPIKTLSGDPPATNSGSFWCFLFGSTSPFTSDTLKSLYPTHDDYVTKVEGSATKIRMAGFILEPEARGFVSDAQAAQVPPN